MSDETIKLKDPANGCEIGYDRQQAHLLYCVFVGDIDKCAAALGVNPVALLKVVEDEKWDVELASLIKLTKSNKPQQLERAVNRALNFCAAHRFRLFLMRALQKMENWSDEELLANIVQTTTDKFGNTTTKVNTRFSADFASALDKMAALSYMALGDGMTERVKRNEEETGGISTEDLHAQIARKMAQVGASQTPRALLFSAQLEQGNELAKTIKKKSITPEDDAHTDDSGG